MLHEYDTPLTNYHYMPTTLGCTWIRIHKCKTSKVLKKMSTSNTNSEGKKVCVTGASGYIASWLVKLLLQRGYTVNATVLHLDDPKEVEHLRSLIGAKERLKLFSVNLVEEGSFDAAVEGCEGVFHTASPCYFDVKDPQAELLDPAVKGTLNVLNACAKVPTIKRVVVTSSMAAVRFSGKPLSPEVTVDETWFSDPKFCCESKQWYVLSKTLAEQAAWKWATEKGIDMPTLNTSTAIIADFFSGSETYANTTMTLIHVKDVAMAHILALELPAANGRYCLTESVVHYSEIVKILQELYPKAALPDKCAEDNPLMPTYEVSKEKMLSLGINCIPLETSLKETVESLKEKGFISI